MPRLAAQLRGQFPQASARRCNEGTSAAFLTCGVRNDENNPPNTVELYVTNRGGADVDVNCTLVDGIFDSTILFANYYPQTVTATAGVDSAFSWSGFDTPWQAISCNVPAQVEANMVYTSIDDQIGT